MKRAFGFVALALLLSLHAPLGACKDPTYVTVHVTTDVPCERLQGVALTVGSLGALEDKVATTRTADCQGNEIGTLTVVPSGEDDGEFGVRVVMGIGRDVDSCTAPAYGDGCVVARRGLRFLPGESVTLPIAMRQICNGIPCGPFDTCVKGVCVPATVDPNDCNGPKGCDEDVLLAGADGGTDGRADGSPSNDNADIEAVLDDFCGIGTTFDRKAAWPMAGGCPTGARRSRFYGPTGAPKISSLDSTPWVSLAIDDQNVIYGLRSLALVRAVVAGGRITATAEVGVPQASDPNDSFAILPDRLLWRRTKEIRVVDRNDAAAGPYLDFTNDAGATFSLLAGWNVGRSPTVFVTYQDDAGVVGLTRADLAAVTATKFITFPTTAPAYPVVAPDGAQVYVATTTSLIAFDALAGSVAFEAADPKLLGAVVVGPSLDIYAMAVSSGRYALRYVRDDNSAAPDPYALFTTATQPYPEFALAAGSVEHELGTGIYDDVILALGDGKLFGVRRTEDSWAGIWTRDVPNAAKMIWTTSGWIYVAGPNKLVAFEAVELTDDGPHPGFSVDAPWTAVYDLAIGADLALYIATDKGLFRAAE